MSSRGAPEPSQSALLKGNFLINTKLSVIVWNEFIQERPNSVIRSIYPEGLHSIIAGALKRTPVFRTKAATLDISTATQDQPEQGLSKARLEACDVLVWWGHLGHDRLSDDVLIRVHRRVLEGMGLIVLHAGYSSKLFQRLLGANRPLKWRTSSEKERLCVVQPSHPISAGLKGLPESPADELCGERFDGAPPDSTVLASRSRSGKAFASGCCWERGYGRLFYFRPSHINESTFGDLNVQRILANAVQWVAPRFRFDVAEAPPLKTPATRHPGYPDCAESVRKTTRTGTPTAASRSRQAIAEKDRASPRHIEAPLFPSLMNQLPQGSAHQQRHPGKKHDLRKIHAEDDRLPSAANEGTLELC